MVSRRTAETAPIIRLRILELLHGGDASHTGIFWKPGGPAPWAAIAASDAGLASFTGLEQADPAMVTVATSAFLRKTDGASARLRHPAPVGDDDLDPAVLLAAGVAQPPSGETPARRLSRRLPRRWRASRSA
ncbi:hypothetical protein AZL_024480 [Azospirillum sp. B510]|nr:hypothetical protein AZL_024480 [Azospirillum sp. B510]